MALMLGLEATIFSIKKLRFKFIKIASNKFFRISKHWVNNKKILLSDREKTIIDCLDMPEYCGGIAEVAKGIWYGKEQFSDNKLLDYALKINNRTVVKRLGYLFEILGIGDGILIDQLREQITKGYSKLDPISPEKGKYLSRWNLCVNISREKLTEWRTH